MYTVIIMYWILIYVHGYHELYCTVLYFMYTVIMMYWPVLYIHCYHNVLNCTICTPLSRGVELYFMYTDIMMYWILLYVHCYHDVRTLRTLLCHCSLPRPKRINWFQPLLSSLCAGGWQLDGSAVTGEVAIGEPCPQCHNTPRQSLHYDHIPKTTLGAQTATEKIQPTMLLRKGWRARVCAALAARLWGRCCPFAAEYTGECILLATRQERAHTSLCSRPERSLWCSRAACAAWARCYFCILHI